MFVPLERPARAGDDDEDDDDNDDGRREIESVLAVGSSDARAQVRVSRGAPSVGVPNPDRAL